MRVCEFVLVLSILILIFSQSAIADTRSNDQVVIANSASLAMIATEDYQAVLRHASKEAISHLAVPTILFRLNLKCRTACYGQCSNVKFSLIQRSLGGADHETRVKRHARSMKRFLTF
ncbi:MAG: hypothetical protein M1429_01055 [Patescibacteria group bacterium]|nr:hypothetical protein [Patescibacteria group bacterium]